MMKKLLLILFSLGLILNGAFGVPKKSKAAKDAPILLDWQGRDAELEIPDWIKFVAENNKRKIIEEFELENYFVWIFDVRGTNLEFLEIWTDKVELHSNIAQSISMEIARATQATMWAEESMDETKADKTIKDVVMTLSNVRVNGLERFASFWIKTGVGKQNAKNKGADGRDISYVYYAVWGVPKNAFKKQLDAAMKNLPEKTAQDFALMKMISASIEKAISDDADESLEGTTYSDVK